MQFQIAMGNFKFIHKLMANKKDKNHSNQARRTDFSILRHLRKNAGLTIEQLSEKSKVSFSVISKLERNIGNPSLETIQNLSAALGLTTPAFVAMAEPLRAVITQSKTHTSGDFTFQLTQMNGLSISVGFAKKDSALFHPERNTKEMEICHVVNGVIEINYSNQSHVLEKGQTIQFGAYFNHEYKVLKDCEIILIHFTKKELHVC
jgi:transcriptional regulator with XRE-family HTH domain